MTSPQPRLRFAAVSMVRDEADIIELFVRINLRVFERIYILDHRSTDHTALILKKLIGEGLAVSYVYSDAHEFQQSYAVTHLVNQVAAMGVFDYIVPLDADEFLSAGAGERLQSLDQHLARNQWGEAPWRTFCPLDGNYFGAGAPLHERFRARRIEPNRTRKVVLGADFARGATVLEGNHKAYHSTLMSEAVALPLYVDHVPVRHADQLMRKALLGQHTLSLKHNRFPYEGAHWDGLARVVRLRGYQVDDAWLRERALDYLNNMRVKDNSLDLDGPRLGEPTDIMVYKDLAQRPVVAALDDYIGQLVAQIQDLRAEIAKDAT